MTGKQIRQIRALVGIHQDELAMRAKLQVASLCRYEAGRGPLSSAQLKRVRVALIWATVRRVTALSKVRELLTNQGI